MHAHALVTKRTYAGLFLVTLATLMYEILLTRIFSVTMFYHFAFLAISVAMFGMTVGAILVYLLPQHFPQERVKSQLALSSLLFALSVVISFLTQLIVIVPAMARPSLTSLYALAFLYVVLSVPFVLSGVCVCLALTRFPTQVSRLYAADLAGAALGCILLVYTLEVTDGPSAVIVVGFLANVGAILFAFDGGSRQLRRTALGSGILLAIFASISTLSAQAQAPLLRVMWVKGQLEPPPIYEKWNSFSRITVVGNPNNSQEPYEQPFGWGLSSSAPADHRVRQFGLLIDGAAITPLTEFDGDFDAVDHLRYDVTNLVHYVRPDSDIFVIGAGGGRDILSALAFDQKSVLAAEINNEIIDTVNRRFGDFTGHLDRDPRVTFVNDEARSYLARQDRQFDIVQLSLIDTWAATAAGAFVLTENLLYTVEAWDIFLEHLTPRGILSVSRWYFRDRPGEVYRLTSLASTALGRLGVENPRERIVIIRHMYQQQTSEWLGSRNTRSAVIPEGIGVGTILVSKAPFSEEDIDTIEATASRMGFDVVLSPRFALDSTFETIASGNDLDRFNAEYPLNIAAPTDDSPFFFQMLRFRDIFDTELWRQGPNTPNVIAALTLGALLFLVAGLTFLCIVVPLILTTKKATLTGTWPLFLFFAVIGLGFMLVEISQMQRLIVFLGHPTYGLSVVLFTLLLSGGLGSYTTQKLSHPGMARSAVVRLLLILGTLIVFGVLAPALTHQLQGATTVIRILVASAMLFPVGFFMGMAFPLGLKLASNRPSLTPWLWGINGATSVCASVLGVTIALSSSISTSFLAGISCYVVAVIAFLWACRSPKRDPVPIA